MAIELDGKHYRIGSVSVSRTNQNGRAISYEVFERVVVPTRMTPVELSREWAIGKKKEDMREEDRDAWVADQLKTRQDTYWTPTDMGANLISVVAENPEAQAYVNLMARFPAAKEI